MATPIYRGDAEPIAQVVKVQPDKVEEGDVFILIINTKQISYTAKAASVADVVTGLVAAWNASTIPEFAEITASEDTSAVVETSLRAATSADSSSAKRFLLTADTAGKPFTVTASTTSTASGALTIAEEVQGAEAVNEVQKLELVGTYTGGTFTITWNPGAGNETTTTIAHNATAATVQTALEGLATPVAGDFLVTGGPGPSTAWFVQFQGTYAATDVNTMTVDGTSLIGNGTVTVTTKTPGTGKSDEIQRLGVIGNAGTFKLTFNGAETSALNLLDATPAQVQTALEALSTIGTGNVAVYGAADRTNVSKALYYVVFKGALTETDVSLLTIDHGNSFVLTHSAGGASSTNEWQFVDCGNAIGGSFTLSFGGETTSAISWNGTQEPGGNAVKDALEALSTLAVGDIEVWQGFGQSTYAIGFIGAKANTNVAELVANFDLLTSATSPTVATMREGKASVDEVQEVVVSGSGGTFTLTFSGQTTAVIAFGATAATVETDLELLSNITNVTVTGTGTAVDPYSVTFVDPGGDVAQMTADAALLTGGGGKSTEVTKGAAAIDEQQKVTLGAGVSSGTFKLSFENVESAAIAYDATAATMKTELELLSTIDGVTVTGAAGGPWTVTFNTGNVADRDIEEMAGDSTNLVISSGTETLTIETLTFSAGPFHFDDKDNWTGNRVPDSLDDIRYEDGDRDCLYGIRQQTTFTADASNEKITFVGGADFVDDQKLRVTNSGGALPAGLAVLTDYFVIALDRDNNQCQLSASSGGAAVNITDAGTGTHTIGLRLKTLRVSSNYTGLLGLPNRTDTDYYEYRQNTLKIGFDSGVANGKDIRIGDGGGSGSNRIRLDVDVDEVDLFVKQTGGAFEAGVPPLLFEGSNTGNSCDMEDGDVGFGFYVGDTTKFDAFNVHGGFFDLGEDVTITVPAGKKSQVNGATFRIRGASLNGVHFTD